MKAVSTSLVIIVSAIVIVLSSIVILIITSGFAPASDLLEQRNICLQKAAANCATTGEMPPLWKNEMQYHDGDRVVISSCYNITGCERCKKNERTGESELIGCTVTE